MQVQTAETKEVESASKSIVKTTWSEPIRISTKASAYYSGNEYIFGTPGSAVDTTNKLGYSGNFKLTNAGNHLYMKMNISGYTADEISDARVMFWTDDTGVNLYSLPDSEWNTTTAPALTSATAIELVSGAEDIPDDYNFTHDTRRLKNYDITSAVKTAIIAEQSEFVLVIEAKSTTYLYYLQNSPARPGMQVQTAVSVDTAATFTGTLAAGNDLTLTYAVDNGWDTDLSVDCIIAVYDSNKALKYVDIETITVSSLDTAGDTFVYTVPADAGDLTGCTAKAMIWNSDFTPLVTVIPLVAVN